MQFDLDFDPQYGKAVRVSPMIERVVCRNGGPFTFMGTGTYIVGDRDVAVIDPGPDDDAHFAALVSALEGRTVSHIIITHTHMDHSPLAERLKQATGAKTFGYGPHAGGVKPGGGQVRLDAGGDYDFVPDVKIDDGDVLEGKGWNLQSVFTPGHTSNHMAFWLREENALFSGDHVMSWSTSIVAPPDGRMGDYMTSLTKLLEHDHDVYWPTHGGPRHDPRPFVKAFLVHRKMREKSVEKQIASGNRTIAGIVKKIYADVDERLHGAAALSTLAHIEHLIERGRIRNEGADGLDGEYCTVD